MVRALQRRDRAVGGLNTTTLLVVYSTVSRAVITGTQLPFPALVRGFFLCRVNPLPHHHCRVAAGPVQVQADSQHVFAALMELRGDAGVQACAAVIVALDIAKIATHATRAQRCIAMKNAKRGNARARFSSTSGLVYWGFDADSRYDAAEHGRRTGQRDGHGALGAGVKHSTTKFVSSHTLRKSAGTE